MAEKPEHKRTTKYCPDCGEERPIEEFYQIKAARYKGGYRYSSHCKHHSYQRTLEARRNAPEGSKLRETMRRHHRRYIKDNPEKNRAHQKTYRQKHPEKVAENYKNWAERNKEKRRESQRRWYERKKQREAAEKQARQEAEERARQEAEEHAQQEGTDGSDGSEKPTGERPASTTAPPST